MAAREGFTPAPRRLNELVCKPRPGAFQMHCSVVAIAQEREGCDDSLVFRYRAGDPLLEQPHFRPVAKVERRIGGGAQRITMARIGGNNGLELLKRLRETLHMAERHTAIVANLAAVGILLQRRPIRLKCFLKSL